MAAIRWRPFCYRCWRAKVLCLCSHVVVQQNDVEILYLQHPNERTMPFNTARLAHLSLSKSRLIRGLRFDADPVIQALHARKPQVGILFPSPQARDLSEAPADLETLIIIDGTWREAKKILFLSPLLMDFPQYAFTPTKPSNYRIRKEPQDNFISTIEATVLALQILTKDPSKYLELLALFDRMVDRQLDFMSMNRLDGVAAPASRLDTRNFAYLKQILFTLPVSERLTALAQYTDGQRKGLESIARELFGIADLYATTELVAAPFAAGLL